MKKYLEIGRISMKTQLAYRFDVYVGALMPFIRVFLAYALWQVLFQGKREIGGFSFGMMLTYYIIGAFIQRLDQSNNMVWDTAGEIREGKFSKYMVRPVSPLGHFLSVSFAKTLYILAVSLLTVVVLALLFGDLFVLPSSLLNVLIAAVMSLLGLLFMALLNYLTALLAFKFNDVTGWHLVKGNVVEFLAGALIPLSLLPGWMQDVMQLFPFYYTQYLPASIYLGLNTNKGLQGILVLMLWDGLLWFLAQRTYHRFRRVYEGVGV
jgi:ABC-2 type transport system permease protein